MSRHFVEHIAFGYSDVAGEVPPSDLQRGELWINGHDFKVWVGQDSPNNFELTAGGGSGGGPGLTAAQLALLNSIPGLDSRLAAVEPQTIDHKNKLTPVAGFVDVGGLQAHASHGVMLDSQGQIDADMLRGVDSQPATAGEVPKFAANGKLKPNLIDFNFATAHVSTTGVNPTVADKQKLVRLNDQGAIDASLLGIDALDYQGALNLAPGSSLTAPAAGNSGTPGMVWIVDAAQHLMVNFATGEVKVFSPPVPAGFVSVKTGDLLIKDHNKELQRVSADAVTTDHLLDRDGTQPMVGDLTFATGAGHVAYDIKGVHAVYASKVESSTLHANATPGAPGALAGTIKGYKIDALDNELIFESGDIGSPPTQERGEIFIDTTNSPDVAHPYFCNGSGVYRDMIPPTPVDGVTLSINSTTGVISLSPTTQTRLGQLEGETAAHTAQLSALQQQVTDLLNTNALLETRVSALEAGFHPIP